MSSIEISRIYLTRSEWKRTFVNQEKGNDDEDSSVLQKKGESLEGGWDKRHVCMDSGVLVEGRRKRTWINLRVVETGKGRRESPWRHHLRILTRTTGRVVAVGGGVHRDPEKVSKTR